MAFTQFALTAAGKGIWSAAQAGLGMELTKVTAGDGVLPAGGSLINRSALISPKIDLPISAIQVADDGLSAVFSVLLSNAALEDGFYLRELGVWAKHPTTGAETLYLYDNSSPDAEWIPPKTGNPVAEYLRIKIMADSASAIVFPPSTADPIALTKEDIADAGAPTAFNLWSAKKVSDSLAALAGAGRTDETVAGAYAAAAAARSKTKAFTLPAAGWTASGGAYTQAVTMAGLSDDYILSWSWATSADGEACVAAELMLDASCDSAGLATLTWTAKALPAGAISVFVVAELPVAVE